MITFEQTISLTNNKDVIYYFVDVSEDKTEATCILSSVRAIEYDIDDKLKWVLLCDLETNSDYRNQGLATRLIEQVTNRLINKGKGIYALVKLLDKESEEKEVYANLFSIFIKNGYRVVTKKKVGEEYYVLVANAPDDKDNYNKLMETEFM